MPRIERTFEREKATEEEKEEMKRSRIRLGRFDYEGYEECADRARSKEEFDFYMYEAHWAFKSAEARVFGN